MKIIGIYKIYSDIDSSKFYIGSSINLKAKKDLHFFLLRNNKHDSKYMQRYFNKHGNVLKFEIIEECTQDILLEREQCYLDALNPYFNSRIRAESNYGLKHSDETKNKISNGDIIMYCKI